MPAGYEVTYIPNQAGIDFVFHDPAGPVGQYLTRLLNQAANAARGLANVDTGRMRSSIYFRVDVEGGLLVGYLGAATNYSVYVHEETWATFGNPFLSDGLRSVT